MTDADMPTYHFTALDGTLGLVLDARYAANRRDFFARHAGTPSSDFADDEFEIHLANIA